jgi:DNA-directed RNA polymerase subunit delta
MKLKNVKPDELELMSYTDIAYMILTQNKKTMKTPDIFKEICSILKFTEDEYVSKIGDFYTSLTMDKRFLLLDSNEWDIRDHHSVEVVLDEEEMDESDMSDEEEMDDEDFESDELEDNIDEVIDDDLDTDIDDLAIVTDDELDEDN